MPLPVEQRCSLAHLVEVGSSSSSSSSPPLAVSSQVSRLSKRESSHTRKTSLRHRRVVCACSRAIVLPIGLSALSLRARLALRRPSVYLFNSGAGIDDTANDDDYDGRHRDHYYRVLLQQQRQHSSKAINPIHYNHHTQRCSALGQSVCTRSLARLH